MAVTDLTDSFPWWARQGAGPTGGPAATPQGAGGPPGANGMGWLNYLSQMFGVSPAQAGEADPIAALRAGGSPVPSALATSGPPVPQSIASLQPAPAGPGYLGSTGVGGGDPRGPDAAMNQMTGMAPGVVNPGYQPPGIIPGRVNPNVAAPNAQPVSAAGPLSASGGASAMGATSNPRFVPVDRPNMSAAGGFGRGGPPQMTALNLAGLFGGGQPAVNPNAPAANAQPVSATRRVAGPLAASAPTNAPWGYGPLQRGNIWRGSGGPRPRS